MGAALCGGGLRTPISACAGPETYTLIRHLLAKMMKDCRCFPGEVTMPTAGPDDRARQLRVNWSFCGDLAVTYTTSGMGGISVRQPCTECVWERQFLGNETS